MNENVISINTIYSIIPIIVCIAGWFVIHHLYSKRDFQNNRKKMRIQYLVKAYQLLECASNREEGHPSLINLEKAIADIHLWGTQIQIELAQQFAKEFAENRCADSGKLLEEIRKDLRLELGLGITSSKWTFLRITTKKINR